MNFFKRLTFFFILGFSSLGITFDLFTNILEGVSLSPFLLLSTGREYFFGQKEENIDERFLKKDIAIVLLHGKGSNKSQFIPLRYYLSKKFDFPIVSFNLNRHKDDENKEYWLFAPKDYTIESLTKTFSRVLDEWSQTMGIKKFIFIGHSLGGIIASYFEQNFAKEIGVEVVMILTIASPMYGSPTLDYLVLKTYGLFKIDLCQEQLKPESELLKGIRKGAKNNSKYFHIVGIRDGLVPKDYAYLEQDEGHVAFFNNGHYYIVINPYVYGEIKRMIDLRLTEIN